jgi:hypothetical protein
VCKTYCLAQAGRVIGKTENEAIAASVRATEEANPELKKAAEREPDHAGPSGEPNGSKANGSAVHPPVSPSALLLSVVVDSVLAWSHLIQPLGCERPAVRRHYSFGSARGCQPTKALRMSPRRASCSKSAGEGAGFGLPFLGASVVGGGR